MAFFKPNTIFLKLDERKNSLQDKYLPIIRETKKRNWGLVLFATFESVGLGIEKTINVWLDVVPENWEDQKQDVNDLRDITSFPVHVHSQGWNQSSEYRL